ncbi:MAG TPA: hypothetical protein ENI09_01930 [candidate division WWE3 bacterium]|uniref:Type 4 fimbrial biogenesis protein PilX N-terminal domain-containing protein n=1 Tax=candidate division WWE3 bacterium TaxID=2053526 RepID=A0A7C1NQN4_UNCKA|nr:hypothetical protein [candidate division WWE3 bacterium]
MINSKIETRKLKSERGYIAFITLLILSAIILLAGVTLALLSISQAQQSLAAEKGEIAYSLAEGCMEDALLSSFFDENYAGGTTSTPEGSCLISVSKIADNWVLISTATIDSGYKRRIRVNILRGTDLQVLSWQQIE